MYLEILRKYKDKYGFNMFAFSLMPQELGLLLELKEGSTISMVMHDLNSSYTKYFNGRYKRRGHLFRSRFKSVVIEKEPYLLNMVRYIHLRPVSLGLAKQPVDFAFNTHLVYLDQLHSRQELSRVINSMLDLGNEINEASELLKKQFPDKKDYAEFMAQVTKEEMEGLRERINSTGVIGSDEFVKSVEEKIKQRLPQKEEITRTLTRPVILISITILLAGVVVGTIYLQKRVETLDKTEKEIAQRLRKTYEEFLEKGPQIGMPLIELDGTEWVIKLHRREEDTHYPAYDKVIFKDGTITSDHFLSRGFSASNYAMSFKDDGTIIWETMQRNNQGDTIFWRGEEKDNAMIGTLSMRGKDGALKKGVSYSSLGYQKF